MTAVRCKFTVASVVKFTIATHGTNDGGTIYLVPVINGSTENEKFFKATPSGSLTFGTVNEEALKQFNVGDQFYIDLTKAN